MRLAFTSDLHCDVTAQNRRLVPYLVDRIADLAPHAVVLAGDIANTLTGWRETLRLFQPLDAPKLIVPGNHDVWIESKRALRRAQDSAWKYNIALRGIAAEYGFHYLPNNPVVLDGIGFAGSLGWYDYSLRDPRLDAVFSIYEYQAGVFVDSMGSTSVWNDTRNAAWLCEPAAEDWRRRQLQMTAREVCSSMLAALESDLEKLAGQVAKVVAIVHTNPFAGCLERGNVPDPFDAYQGSARLGEMLAQFRRRREVLVICGHLHQPLDISQMGVLVLRCPVGYLDGFEGDYGAKATEVVRLIVL